MIVSAALDLGTTRIKGALLDDSGNISQLKTASAPPVKGKELIRESSASEYIEKVENVFQQLYRNIPDTIPLGVSSQRSSFLLWEKETSMPVTPLISWMDRRALKWTQNNIEKKETITKNTGLPFSPHYAGPKLASILEEEPALKAKAERGLILFGTIECYLIWLWSKGETHVTDATMASRTLMYDLNNREWSSEKLDLYGIPEVVLPTIRTSHNMEITLKNRPVIRAIPADQPSAFYASAFTCPEIPVVNLGTGGFVMSLCNKNKYVPGGLLYTPLYSGANSTISYGLEGTINGVTTSMKKTGGASKNFSNPLPPETFCLPDSNGTGSPYWNPSRSLIFSSNCSPLEGSEKRRVLFEGIVFRVAEIIDAMDLDSNEISLSGGLSHNPFFKKGLATCLNRNVRSSGTAEGSLMGAALMAAGNLTSVRQRVSITYPSKNQTLRNKYFLWREWMKKIMST